MKTSMRMDVNMDMETLVAAVARAVAEHLEQRPRPVALVLAPAGTALARQVEERLARCEMPMRVCFDAPGEEPALYIVPEISCSDMADLAAGKASSLNMHRVLDLLLAGKPVRTLGYTFRAHADTAPPALLRLYEGHAAALAEYGLAELPVAADDARVRETLVTAEHVAQAAARGARVLHVPRRALVTALAEENAAERRMTILKDL